MIARALVREPSRLSHLEPYVPRETQYVFEEEGMAPDETYDIDSVHT